MRVQTPAVRLLAACGLGLAFTAGLYFTLQGGSPLQAPAEASVKVPVVTIKADVPALTRLAPEHVAVQHVPPELVPADAITDASALEGRFVRTAMYANETVLEAKLFPAGQEYPTVLPLPVGKRAVTVAVNEVVGVAGFVSVGSVVDVIATLDLEDKSVSRIIMQGIQVLAAAQSPQREEDPQAKVVSSVTLAVDPEQAEQLTLATEKGTIRLAMRSPLEEGKVKTEGETPLSLVGMKKPAVPTAAAPKRASKPAPRVASRPAPAAPPRAVDPGIMVIRGTHTSFVHR